MDSQRTRRARRAALRRRLLAWAAAIGLHLALFYVIAGDWSAHLAPPPPRPVQITLERLERRDTPTPVAQVRPEPPAFRAPPPLARPVEAPVPPLIAPGLGRAPGAATGSGAASGGGRGATATAEAPFIRVPCTGDLSRLEPLRRAECERYNLSPARTAKLSKSLANQPNMSTELQAEFEQAYKQRRANDPTPKTGPVIEDMTIQLWSSNPGANAKPPSAPPVFKRPKIDGVPSPMK